MNDDDKKLLEKFMGRKRIKPKHGPCCTCTACGHIYYECICTDWDTREDMMDLYETIAKNGEWSKFIEDIYYDWEDKRVVGSGPGEFMDWLFCLSDKNYKERCQIVAEWIDQNKVKRINIKKLVEYVDKQIPKILTV